MDILKRPQARRDLAELAEFIERANPGAGFRFQDAAKRAMRFLSTMPLAGGVWESGDRRIKGVRVWRIRGFKKYLIFYRPIANGIEVIRILHGARDIGKALGE